jgi:lipopolysaccharide biosynthesis regulator YciM
MTHKKDSNSRLGRSLFGNISVYSDADGLTKNLIKVIMLDDKNAKAYKLLGEIYLYRKEYEKAVENLKKVKDLKGN